ncbi:MAG: 4-(cytidine 5'-diphospho)-2-C-methyl-D-erythritol kinase [Clostridia bacterium]|nr:4-(cytidine 5'-diphospho)-2-C-methyl-D-erythritol kinase [Clostridia bacterium]
MKDKKSISLRANAKINLFLDIESRRENGYHTVKSLMHSVSLSDTVDITVSPSDTTQIAITSSSPSVPTDRTNLAWRAAEAFLSAVGTTCRVEIYIEKNIPIASGLAGGSTDAAAVFRGLNELFDNKFDTQSLCDMGARLGADIPFCIVGGSKRVGGIGEILADAAVMPDCKIVIACGGEGVSTPWAYGKLDSMYSAFDGSAYSCRTEIFDALTHSLRAGDMSGICNNAYNIFESAVLCERPVAQRIKDVMMEAGARGAMMSGSGPSVFGIFDLDCDGAERAVALLAKEGIVGHICCPAGEN